MKRALVPALALAALGGLAGCGVEEATQIVVVIDTDLPVPAELDTIVIEVIGPSTEDTLQTVSIGGADATPLPLTFGMVPGGSQLGPVTVTVTGRVAGTDVITRVVRTRFLERQSRLLRIRLQRACLGVACGELETCDDGVCRDQVVDPEELPRFEGEVRIPELCNERDEDGDDRVDEDFDLQNDTQNCGACGVTCTAGRPCQAGTCVDSPIVMIAAGASHTCALREAGGVACWGSNSVGELGNGSVMDSTSPVTVEGLNDARFITSGTLYSCVARADGTSACWGSGLGGELGIGVYENRSTPARTLGVTEAIQSHAGFYHSCALRSTGSIRCWGQGNFGELGTGMTTPMVPEPVDVVDIMDATDIRLGFQHTCARRMSGEVACWGDGSSGQIGDGMSMARSRPTRVMGITDAIEVAAGETHSCARTQRGTIECWGGNERGQLGLDPMTPTSPMPTPVPMLPEPPIQIAAPNNGRFMCMVGTSGAVYCWGANNVGQLGDGAPTAARPAIVPVMGLAGARQVSTGTEYACALLESPREVWCWGDNSSGQLGDGTRTNSAVPVRVNSL